MGMIRLRKLDTQIGHAESAACSYLGDELILFIVSSVIAL